MGVLVITDFHSEYRHYFYIPAPDSLLNHHAAKQVVNSATMGKKEHQCLPCLLIRLRKDAWSNWDA